MPRIRIGGGGVVGGILGGGGGSPVPGGWNPFSGIGSKHRPKFKNPFNDGSDPLKGQKLPYKVKNIGNLDDVSEVVKDAIAMALAPGILGPMHAALLIAYFQYVEMQARGKLKQLKEPLQRRLQHEYNVNLEQVYYAEDINTVHGAHMTIGNHIYFTRSVDFNDEDDIKKNDLALLMHELEHCVQWREHGKELFLVKYAAQTIQSLVNHRFVNTHDFMPIEDQANKKARRLFPKVFDRFQFSPGKGKHAGWFLDFDDKVATQPYKTFLFARNLMLNQKSQKGTYWKVKIYDKGVQISPTAGSFTAFWLDYDTSSSKQSKNGKYDVWDCLTLINSSAASGTFWNVERYGAFIRIKARTGKLKGWYLDCDRTGKPVLCEQGSQSSFWSV